MASTGSCIDFLLPLKNEVFLLSVGVSFDVFLSFALVFGKVCACCGLGAIDFPGRPAPMGKLPTWPAVLVPLCEYACFFEIVDSLYEVGVPLEEPKTRLKKPGLSFSLEVDAEVAVLGGRG